MRAKEFITEFRAKASGEVGPIADSVSDALPGVFVQHSLRNTDPYMQYRYGLAVAAARAIKNGDLQRDQYNDETAWSENLTQVMFAQEDEETIRLASELFGVSPTQIANTKSSESPSTNKTSPVAKPKRNKYGV